MIKLCKKPGDTDASKEGSSEAIEKGEESNSEFLVGSGESGGIDTLAEGEGDTDGEGAGEIRNKGVTSGDRDANVPVTALAGLVN